MALQFFNQVSDYLHPGSPSDSRLFHADPSDQIQVWSPQVGQGYTQTIPLQEGLSLVIMDYAIHSTCLSRVPGPQGRWLELEFQMVGPGAGQSRFLPYLGSQNGLNVRPAQPPQFRVEVICRPPLFESYSQTLIEHMAPQDQAILYDWAHWVHRSQRGYRAASSQRAFGQILQGQIASPQAFSADDPFEKLDFWAFGRSWRSMTAEMHQVISQILSCPYSGQVRRAYLERLTLELIALKLKGLNHLKQLSYPLVTEDLDGIYQGAKVLACNLNNPPSINDLARQVGLNRLKLNQGFHQVYGTTPFRYLRNCRLALARHLLTTSEFAVETIAHQVGYTSRSNFASAFRQQFGLNPKTFQLYSQNGPQPQSRAS